MSIDKGLPPVPKQIIPRPRRKMKLFGDVMLVLRDAPRDREGRIYKPEIAQQVPNTGIVLLTGPGRWIERQNPSTEMRASAPGEYQANYTQHRMPMEIHPGDKVMFNLSDVMPLDLLDEDQKADYVLLREQNAWGVITNEAAPAELLAHL